MWYYLLERIGGFNDNSAGEKMSDLKKLGANLRSLRLAFGETQEQLGEAIFVEKNTISYYETGKREPNKGTLSAIADHYMVSVDEILYSDLTSIRGIDLNADKLRKGIGIILPIVTSDNAMKNASFKNAYETHKRFYKRYSTVSPNEIDNVIDHDLDDCFNAYSTAFENDTIRIETLVNCAALWFLMLMPLQLVSLIIKQPAGIRQMEAKDENGKKEFESINSTDEAEAIVAMNEDGTEMKKELVAMLKRIKKSKGWSDIADYYISLLYVMDLVDNGLNWSFNQRIGLEMLKSFSALNNKYASSCLRFIITSTKG